MASKVTVKGEFCGVQHHFVLSGEAGELPGLCVRSGDDAAAVAALLAGGGDATATVEILHVDDSGDGDGGSEDMPEDVGLVWIATVVGNLRVARALLDAGAEPQEIVDLAKRAALHTDDPAPCDRLTAALSGGTWLVPMQELLLDPPVDAGSLRRLQAMGFGASDTDCAVAGGDHELAMLFASVAPTSAGSPSLEPFQEGNCFCPADLAVLKSADESAGLGDALSARLALGGPLTWVGHVLWKVSAGDDDASFRTVADHQSLWAYLSDQGDVDKEELVRQREGDGGVFVYKTRVERYTDEVLPQMRRERQQQITGLIAARVSEVKHSCPSHLIDYVEEALQAAAAAHAATQAAGSAADDSGEAASSEQQFDAACVRAKSLKGVKDQDKLLLYGLYKQASEGDCTQPKPGMMDFRGKAKWGAWMDQKGKAADVAKSEYAAAVARLGGVA